MNSNLKTKTSIKKWMTVWGAGMGTLSCAAIVAWAAGGSKLMMNGNLVSSGVRTINGKSYVPLADLAKANGMVVVPISGGYEIKTPGGANPISGMQGKVGDVLFDGKWRFQVLSAETVASYRMKYKSTIDYALYNPVANFDNDSNTFTPEAGRVLIAIKGRVTNGRNKGTHALWINNNDTRTALADADGESHPPFVYDLDESTPFQSKALLPGAKTDFTILFSVPEADKMKDLVFTLRTIDNKDKGNDARVSLTN